MNAERSCEAAVAAVEAAGCRALMPRVAIAGVGRLACCRDTEGTVFGVMESDAAAR